MSSDIDPKTLSYEAEVAPRWAEPFARLLLSVAPIDPKAMVLDVLCGTGSTSVPLLDRLERGRVVALDPSSSRIAVSRRKAGALISRPARDRARPNAATTPQRARRAPTPTTPPHQVIPPLAPPTEPPLHNDQTQDTAGAADHGDRKRSPVAAR